MNENIKKFEYYIFIKKIKEEIYIKNRIKENIILFQKRSALDQLLINIIYEMKNNILKEKLKILLIKKFIYNAKNNYLNSYKSETKYKENQRNKRANSEFLKDKKNAFNDFLIKFNIFSFLKKTRICINNMQIKKIQENYKQEKRKEYFNNYFQKIKLFKSFHFSKEKEIFFQKIFFKIVKNNLLNKSKDINIKNKLNNIKRLFLYKTFFHLFQKKCKENNDKINKVNLLKQKIAEFQEKEKKSQEIKKFFKIFINNAKRMKQKNNFLKRRIFNILKNNVAITKDLKYYLNEAEKVE